MEASQAGDCDDFAVYFTGTLKSAGLDTMIIGESLKYPDGSVHYAPMNGHFVGIATDGQHAWANNNQKVIELSTVQEAMDVGGKAMFPAGTQVSKPVILDGGEGFMQSVSRKDLRWADF